MKTKALYTALSQKIKDNEILFVDSLSFDVPKTVEAKEVLRSFSKISHFEKINTKRKNSALIALSEKNSSTEKSFRNFGNIEVSEMRNLNPVDVLKYKYIVLVNPKATISFLESKSSKKS